VNAGLKSRFRRLLALAVVVLFCADCTVTGAGQAPDGHTEAYGVTLYEPFDNSRDWGPSYLMGPPLRDKIYPNDDSNRTADSVLVPQRSRKAVPSIPDRFPDPLPTPDPKSDADSSVPSSPVP
jgi:hypothetical protein